MKCRVLIIIAVFLFAGVVVNATVAWGCWAGSDATLVTKLWFPNMLDAKALEIADDLGFAPQISTPIVQARGMTIHSGFKTTLDVIQISQFEAVEWPYAAVISDISREPASVTYVSAVRFQAGWPTHTLRGYEITVQDMALFPWAYPSWKGRSPFPLLPIWPGFAVNSLLYAVVLWLLICGPFVPRRVIRAIRVKRGGCPACGYPAGRSDVCSECGKPLPERIAGFIR